MKIDSSDSLSSQLESEIIEKVEEKPPVPAPPEPEAAASNEVKAMKIDSSDSLSSQLESEIIEKVEEKLPVLAPPEPEAAASNENETLLRDIFEKIRKMEVEIATFRKMEVEIATLRKENQEHWEGANRMDVASVIFALGAFLATLTMSKPNSQGINTYI